MKTKDEKDPKGQKEVCVLCGAETGYSRSVPIEFRLHYVEAAGQLCENCYKEVIL